MKERLSAAIRILVPPSLVHRQPLLLFVGAAATGIVVDSVVNLSASVWSLLTISLIGLFAVLHIRRSAKPVATAVIVLMIMPMSALWHQVRRQHYDSASIRQFIGDDAQPTILVGVVDRPVVLRRHPLAGQSWRRDQSPWQSQLEVRLEQIRRGLDWQGVDGRVLVMVDGRRDELRPGDSVRVYGSIQRFLGPANPGAQDFREIYRRRNIHARVHVDSIDQIEALGQPSWRPGRWIATIARAGRERLMMYTGTETGPLAIALVIGQREFVGPELRDRLLVTGTVHLLSVSGLHLAIIVVLAHWAATLGRFPPSTKFIWIFGICLLYTAVTGARPPVVRAAVLVTTFMVAYLVKRPSQPINTLSLAALIILAWNPTLIFGIGVQLSFLAVATLLLCRQGTQSESVALSMAVKQEDKLQALAEKSRSKATYYARYVVAGIGRAIWYSGCVTAISMPLVWYQFHVVSPISVVTNVVLSPILFVALASGVATVVFGAIAPLGWIFGTICDWTITAMAWVIDVAASIPLGHHWLPSPSSLWVVMFYVVMLFTLYLARGKTASNLRYGWIAVWAVVAFVSATTKEPLEEGSIEATFVDVGHGTSVVLRSGDQVWLYDCGRLGNDTGRSRDIDATLWSMGVTELDGIYLSHADTDHFNALPGVLQRFDVNQVVTPPGMLQDPEPAVVQVRQVIRRSNVPVREISDGRIERFGSHSGSVLHPPTERVKGTDNANSLVLLIDSGGTSLILPGDLEPPGTAALIEHPRPPPGGVLMAPHHGSLRMDAASVLQWARPRETIVSGGRRAKRPEVHEMLSATGSGVHVTSQVGAIRVLIDREGRIEVRSWMEDPW
jgi:competence protein ComEC